MRGRFSRSGNRALACLAVIGAAGAGGLAAGFVAKGGVSSHPATVIVEMSPADTVNMRFPADWGETAVAEAPAAPAPVAGMLTLASADGSFSLLSPKPFYPLTEAKAELPDARARTQAAEPVPMPRAAPVRTAAAAAPAKLALASVASKPVPHRRSNAVLNDSQIAGIKKRLNLSPDQERYWPAVEAELRKMEYKRDGKASSRMAQIDMSKVDVDGLKSAGFPLVMSFSDDQRRELKSLAHLLGLESVMSGL
jgi:hypothetical protein